MLLNTKEKETGVKFNPGLSANWLSNNWAQEGTKKFNLLRNTDILPDVASFHP